MMDRWIKIHSKIVEWEWSDIPEMLALWVHCLFLANSQDKKWHGVVIPRGSFVTSRSSLAEIVGISEKQVRTCLARLEMANAVTIKRTNRYSLVTICKYDLYQLPENDEGQQKGQQEGRQRATTNNIALSIESSTNVESSISKAHVAQAELDYDRVKRMWRETCTGLGDIRLFSESRKAKLKLRMKEMAKAYPERDVYETLQDFFNRVQASDFLKGHGSQGWKATFDWLFENDHRWLKTMEGGFDNRQGPKAQGGPTLDINRIWD